MLDKIPRMAHSASALFRLIPPLPNKLAKKAEPPVVLGVHAKLPSWYISLDPLKDCNPGRVGSPKSLRSASRQPITSTRPRLISVKLQPNASWLHDRWNPGLDRARTVPVEPLAAAQRNFGRRALAPMPPVQTCTPPSAPTPPPAPTNAGEALGRSDAQPGTDQFRTDLLAELSNHRLVRRDPAIETKGTGPDVASGSALSEKKTLPLTERPLDPFQDALKKRIEMGKPTAPIKVTKEVKRQAEQRRQQLQAERDAAMRNVPSKRTEQTTPESEKPAFDTLKRNLIAELVQSARFGIRSSGSVS